MERQRSAGRVSILVLYAFQRLHPCIGLVCWRHLLCATRKAKLEVQVECMHPQLQCMSADCSVYV